ncbi:MAG: ATP-binding protein, partial [Victivallaceae bacterium]|nr:ATP-binding protein [Victivallaceae bacterium]
QDVLRAAAHLAELIVERQNGREQLLGALNQAQSAAKAKSYFLASMSHEIRTPLNAVIGFAELLRDGSLPPEKQQSYLTSISNAGTALLALINDVLDLSKLEAEQMLFTPVETNFPLLVQEVGSIFQEKCEEKKLQLVIDIPNMPPVMLDKLRLRQILFNLVGNAVKFTDRGSIVVKAMFKTLTGSEGTLCFLVADTGMGISKADAQRLFQPFVQSNAVRGTSAANNGTGLGLAITRRMLEQMDGRIELESIPGKGSTFTVVIKHVPFVANRPEASRVAMESRAAAPVPAPEFHGKALLVDDVPVNLQVLEAMLHKLKIETCTAANGEEALNQLASHEDIAIVLTDMWMPGMNGGELAVQVRKRNQNLPIVAVTADVEAHENFELEAFSGILLKPVTVDKLARLLHSIPGR